MASEDRRRGRERREAEVRAEQRRAHLLSAGAMGDAPTPAPVPPTPTTSPELRQPPMGRPSQPPVSQPANTQYPLNLAPMDESPRRYNFPAASTVVPLAAIACSVGISLAALSGLPVTGHSWSIAGFIPLIAGVAGGYVLVRAWFSSPVASRVLAASMLLLAPIAAVAGATSQVTVAGKPVLHGSAADRSSRLAASILSDLYTLEDNQKLLNIPDEQARGLSSVLTAAVTQDSEIAARWNPATAKDLPLPGFNAVFDIVNRTADLQARTISLRIADLQQADSARQQAISDQRDQIMFLLTGDAGAAALLARTVAPLGIKLDGGAK